MAIRLVWQYFLNRTKSIVKNYNVIERAEKSLEQEKRISPRHPGTEIKFQVLVKGSREIKNDLEKKPTELLDRLKIVKVSSEGTGENPVSNRPLPQERRAMQVPLFGYEESKVIPEGKCSLRQALAFITKHQNDPTKHSAKSIAEAHFMKESDIENIIKYFRAFEVYISRDGKTTVAKTTLENMGARKIVAPIFKPKFAHLEPQNMPNHDMPLEKK